MIRMTVANTDDLGHQIPGRYSTRQIEKTPQIQKPSKLTKKQKLARALIVSAVGAVVLIKIYLLIFVIDPLVGIYGVITTSLVFVAFLFAFAKYKDPSSDTGAKHPKNALQTPFVTVIIPAKNDPVIIKKSVNAILNSTYPKVEVIFVNDGSTDNTSQVMDELHYANPESVKVIHLVQNIGKRKAIREAVLKGAPRGDIFVLVDSDSVVETDAIERLVRAFDDPDVGAATGTAKAMNADENILTRMQDAWYDGQFFIMKGMESSFNSVTCCSGSLSAYRKEAIMPCLDKWCDDTFLGAEFRPGDDRHLTSYVLGGNKHYIDSHHKAWKVVYCENAVVHTEVPSKLRKFINQQIRWKKSWVRVFLFNAPFFYKNRSLVSWLYYYTQMTLSLVSPIIAFRAMFLLPMQERYFDSIFYLSGLLFLGFMYAAVYKLRNPNSGNRWLYRILIMGLSVPLGFLLYYALMTVKKTSWLTR